MGTAMRENDRTQNNWTAYDGSAFTQAISQAKSSSAQALKALIRTNKLFFDTHIAARERQEPSVRPIWQAGRQG